MPKIIWNQKPAKVSNVYFCDLAVGECFRLSSGEAVYQKVKAGRAGICDSDYKGMGKLDAEEYMLELATGLLWPESGSPVVKVDVQTYIDAAKPTLYKL